MSTRDSLTNKRGNFRQKSLLRTPDVRPLALLRACSSIRAAAWRVSAGGDIGDGLAARGNKKLVKAALAKLHLEVAHVSYWDYPKHVSMNSSSRALIQERSEFSESVDAKLNRAVQDALPEHAASVVSELGSRFKVTAALLHICQSSIAHDLRPV